MSTTTLMGSDTGDSRRASDLHAEIAALLQQARAELGGGETPQVAVLLESVDRLLFEMVDGAHGFPRPFHAPAIRAI